MAKNLNEHLQADLDAAVKSGVLTAWSSANPTGNKLVWTLSLTKDAGEFTGQNLETKEAKAFVAGLSVSVSVSGRERRKTPGPVRQPNSLRDAIAKTGRVEYAVPDPSDPAAMKKARNMLFSLGYSLGHKGAFKVTTKDGGVLVGEVTGGAAEAA